MAPDPSTDASDVRLAIAGDAEAYGRLYDRHAPGVRAVAAAVGRDFDAVEDLTQEAFLRGYRKLASLRDADGFGPWVRGIARRVAQERKRMRRHHSLIGDPSPALETGDGLEEHEERRRVLAALADLPERERLAIHAFYFTEQRPAVAADKLGMSRSGYYAALERGMNRLRRALGATGDLAPQSEADP